MIARSALRVDRITKCGTGSKSIEMSGWCALKHVNCGDRKKQPSRAQHARDGVGDRADVLLVQARNAHPPGANQIYAVLGA
ncbi:hypothetical protein B0O95_1128 [Mycetohabitans endofungorum]|uniref:Uncharacterized protein n=1 Tax=Mycetohabitans endofungorum TaxID=417203 RepID=A0A2P5K7Y5_9BURK|nr:hypothetical protein B0O95_1128 [Mycetohabitans endofungorum]